MQGPIIGTACRMVVGARDNIALCSYSRGGAAAAADLLQRPRALAELLDRGQLIGVRGAIDREAQVLKVAVSRRRRGFEARKAIEAHDLAKAVRSDKSLNEAKVGIRA